MVGAVLAGDGVALGFSVGAGVGEGVAVGGGVFFLLGFGVGVGGGTLNRIWHAKSGCVSGHAKPLGASASGYVAGPGDGVAELLFAVVPAVEVLAGVAPPTPPGGSGVPCCPELKLPEHAPAISMSTASAGLDKLGRLSSFDTRIEDALLRMTPHAHRRCATQDDTLFRMTHYGSVLPRVARLDTLTMTHFIHHCTLRSHNTSNGGPR